MKAPAASGGSRFPVRGHCGTLWHCFNAGLTSMQDDLFGDANPQPSIPDQERVVRDADTASRAVRRVDKVRLAPASQAWREVARRLPAQLRFGVSTWSYPGWEGLVWDGSYEPSTLSRHGLAAYHRHPLLRTVCVDRTTRAVLARTIRGITGAGQPAYVTISNDAEGCAPLSVQKLTQAVDSLMSDQD